MGFILTRMSYTYMIHFNYSHLVTLASPPRLSLIAFLFPTIPPTVVVCVCACGEGEHKHACTTEGRSGPGIPGADIAGVGEELALNLGPLGKQGTLTSLPRCTLRFFPPPP